MNNLYIVPFAAQALMCAFITGKARSAGWASAALGWTCAAALFWYAA
jgi:hypothetical protein